MLNHESPYPHQAGPSFLHPSYFPLLQLTQSNEGSAKETLSAIRLEDLFTQPLANQDFAACCLAGLWLLHSHLDESHEISQSLKSREGSYWHGIMHREEKDFWNSKYWFQKTGPHPIHDEVWGEYSNQTPESAPRSTDLFDSNLTFLPDAFVDYCERAERSPGAVEERECERIKAIEWRLLFEFCGFRAIGQ